MLKRERKALIIGAAAGGVLLIAFLVLTAMTRFSRSTVSSLPTIIMVLPDFVSTSEPESENLTEEFPSFTDDELPLSGQQNFLLTQWVQISNTGGVGLRLRTEAGVDSSIVFVALENELFEIRGGPVNIDETRWWFLVNPYEEAQSGWADDRYLRSVDN